MITGKNMLDISNLNKVQLKDLSKKLKLLSSLKKSLGKRGEKEYQRIQNGVNAYVVEYFDTQDVSFIRQSALNAFQKKFWVTLDESQVEFRINNTLQWGFRIFCNDMMCDFSFKRFENLMK